MSDELVDHEHLLEYVFREHEWRCVLCPAVMGAEHMPVVVEQELT